VIHPQRGALAAAEVRGGLARLEEHAAEHAAPEVRVAQHPEVDDRGPGAAPAEAVGLGAGAAGGAITIFTSAGAVAGGAAGGAASGWAGGRAALSSGRSPRRTRLRVGGPMSSRPLTVTLATSHSSTRSGALDPLR